VSTALAESFAMSVAFMTAIPTSACFNAGASFVPSPGTSMAAASSLALSLVTTTPFFARKKSYY
jgi:hypothetical protein